MIAREGVPIIIWTGIIFIVFLILSLIFKNKILLGVSGLVFIIFIFHFFFFRDPERSFDGPPTVIVAPADGKVILIEKVEEPVYIKGPAQKISIFMSVFNCHVNRIPATGTVEYLRHKPGQFLNAMNHRTGEENEQQMIGINTPYGKIFFKQIAGLIARRIVCKLQPGQKVQRSQRFGLIRYGSRLDVFLPMNVEVKVKLNQKTVAGETIIGEFNP
ncbi:phosphatidylserine decarboxylase family protein [Calditrichota bacterium LG25]